MQIPGRSRRRVIKGLRPASGVLVPQRVVEAHPAVRAPPPRRVSGPPGQRVRRARVSKELAVYAVGKIEVHTVPSMCPLHIFSPHGLDASATQ